MPHRSRSPGRLQPLCSRQRKLRGANSLSRVKLELGHLCQSGGCERSLRVYALYVDGKGVPGMNKTRFCEFTVLVCGVSILCGASQAQNALPLPNPAVQGTAAPTEGIQASNTTSSAPAPTLHRVPRTVAPTLQQKKPISLDDLLAGITLTDEQKPKIEQLRKDMRIRMDTVINDKKETVDQKWAMIDGLQRIELREVYLLLTPDQQQEIRTKVMAQRAAEQKAKQVRPGSGLK